MTRGATDLALTSLLHRLNPVLRGWTAYFRHGVSKATFNYLRAFVSFQTACLPPTRKRVWRKHRSGGPLLHGINIAWASGCISRRMIRP